MTTTLQSVRARNYVGGMNRDCPVVTRDCTVGSVARSWPGAIDIFEELAIDYACRGRRTLAEAASIAGLDVDVLIRRISLIAAKAGRRREPSLVELLSDRFRFEHAAEKERLRQLSRTVATQCHGSETMERLGRTYLELEKLSIEHMEREERELYPALQEFLRLGVAATDSLSHHVRAQEIEHDHLREYLLAIRELCLRAVAEGRTDPVLGEFSEFERHTLRHLHFENNVLLPKALELTKAPKLAAVV